MNKLRAALWRAGVPQGCGGVLAPSSLEAGHTMASHPLHRQHPEAVFTERQCAYTIRPASCAWNVHHSSRRSAYSGIFTHLCQGSATLCRAVANLYG